MSERKPLTDEQLDGTWKEMLKPEAKKPPRLDRFGVGAVHTVRCRRLEAPRIQFLPTLWPPADGCRVGNAGKEAGPPMTTWLIIALALCIVCGVGVALIARRRKHKPLKTKIVYMADTPTVVYVFEESATKNKGCVWKCDYTGPQFSSTGFDGPYTKVEDMLL